MAKIDLKELRDLTKDVKLEGVLDDVRGALSERADALLGDGRSRARRAVGGHDDSALFLTFSLGIVVGALAGAAVALLMTPMSGQDARKKLGEQVDRLKAGDEGRTGWDAGNGKTAYQPASGAPERSTF